MYKNNLIDNKELVAVLDAIIECPVKKNIRGEMRYLYYDETHMFEWTIKGGNVDNVYLIMYTKVGPRPSLVGHMTYQEYDLHTGERIKQFKLDLEDMLYVVIKHLNEFKERLECGIDS